MFKEIARNILKDDIEMMEQRIQQGDDSLELFQERLAELELALEDIGWTKMGFETYREFSREGLKKIDRLARMMWLKNPLIKRAVLTQTQYVFGQGMEVQSENEDVNKVIQAFMDDAKNRVELTSHQSRIIKESELQVFANLYFVMFVDPSTGRIRVRTIPCDELEDIICNPEDQKEPWFYKRVYSAKKYNMDKGFYETEHKTVYYMDWRIPVSEKRATIGGHEVVQDAFVYHVATNKLSDMKFGVSEVYAALDWARAYKEFLENWASLVKAYSRFAWQLTGKGGRKAVQSAKEKLNTTVGTDHGMDRNPPNVTASTFIGNQGTKLEPIKTAGATTKAEDGQHMIHMVSAATGIFYHYLVGDPSTGNLATAKAMERPMELMFKDRQTLWKTIHKDILKFAIKQSIKAPNGYLNGKVNLVENELGQERLEVDGEEVRIEVTFPDLLEKDMEKRIGAIIDAATLKGQPLTTMTLRKVTRMLLVELGVEDVDEMLDEMIPVDNEIDPNQTEDESEVMGEAIRELREAVIELAKKTA